MSSPVAVRIRLTLEPGSHPAAIAAAQKNINHHPADLWHRLFSPIFKNSASTKIGLGIAFGVVGTAGLILGIVPKGKQLVSHTPEWEKAEKQIRKERNILP